MVKFIRLSVNAIKPVQSTPQAAGFDLYSAYDVVVPSQNKALIKTDIALEFPNNCCYGHIAPRSGLALHNFIQIGGGIIDADYRGNIGVILFNHSDQVFFVKIGDRIAQIIFQKIMLPKLVEETKLTTTKRGDAGFGSTGL